MIRQDYFLQIRHSHFPDGPVTATPSGLPEICGRQRREYISPDLQERPEILSVLKDKLGSIFNFLSISSIFLINFSVFKLKNFESHIWQQDVFLTDIFPFSAFTRLTILEFRIVFLCLIYNIDVTCI